MQAIETRHMPPTNCRGARYQVRWDKETRYYSAEDIETAPGYRADDAHEAAARRIIDLNEIDMTDRVLVSAQLPSGSIAHIIIDR